MESHIQRSLNPYNERLLLDPTLAFLAELNIVGKHELSQKDSCFVVSEAKHEEKNS